jgi:hypothetical protein
MCRLLPWLSRDRSCLFKPPRTSTGEFAIPTFRIFKNLKCEGKLKKKSPDHCRGN